MTIETFDQYRALAMRTDDLTRTPEQRLHNAALGLIGELGEVCDLFKKHLYHGHTLNGDKLAKELGDLCWYLAVIADVEQIGSVIADVESDIKCICDFEVMITNLYSGVYDIASNILHYRRCDSPRAIENALQDIDWFADYLGLSIQDIWKLNVTKLRQRYPDGFSSEASINRVV